MIKELSVIALMENIPSHKLEAGDVGTVVFIHKDEKFFEVEFLTNDGKTIAVLTLKDSQIRETEGSGEIMHVREWLT